MNSSPPTDWLPGILMLAAGAIAALAYVFGARKPSSAPPKSGSTDDLEARYQDKIAQLREHQANKHLQAPAKWNSVRARLESEAAAVLRERNGVKHEKLKAAVRAERKATAMAKDDGLTRKHPTLTVAVLGSVVVGFFVLVAFTLSESTSSRKDEMQATGRPGMGGMGMGGAAQQEAEQEDPRLVALGQRVQTNPEDPDAVGDLAMYLIRRQAFDDARPLIDRVTRLDPFSVKGRVARAVMLAVNGDAKSSQDELEHLSVFYPEAYDARMFAGLISMEVNDQPRALRNLEAYVATAPSSEQPPMMRSLIRQIKAQLDAPPK